MTIVTDDLTDRQYSVLSFIVAYQQKHHMAPTVREIATHVGMRSPAGVHRILGVLKARGYLLSEPAKNRAWRFSGTLSEAGTPVVGAIAAGKQELPADNLHRQRAPPGSNCRETGGCDPPVMSKAYTLLPPSWGEFPIRCWEFPGRR